MQLSGNTTKKLYLEAYASKKMICTEKRYSILEKEYLTNMWGITKFLLVLAGKLLISQTDHQAMAHLNKTKYQNDCMMQWHLALQNYDYHVQDTKRTILLSTSLVNRLIDIDCTCICYHAYDDLRLHYILLMPMHTIEYLCLELEFVKFYYLYLQGADKVLGQNIILNLITLKHKH